MNNNQYRKMMNKIHVSETKRRETAELLNHYPADIKVDRAKAGRLTSGTVYRIIAAAACLAVALTFIFTISPMNQKIPVSINSAAENVDGPSKNKTVPVSSSKGTTPRSTQTASISPAPRVLSSNKYYTLAEPVLPKSISYGDYQAYTQLLAANPVEKTFTNAVQTFSWRTASQILSTQDSNINSNYSPVSLYMALALAGTGAGGQTRKEIFSLLNVEGKSDNYLSAQSGNLFRQLYHSNEVGTLKIADSIWLNQHCDFQKSYVQNAVDHFYASAYNVDFADDNTPARISKWISDNTNGRLSLIDSIDKKQLMTIVNTIYFKDAWINQFDNSQTAQDVFYLGNGKQTRCNYMNGTKDEYCVKGNGFTSTSLSFRNGESMWFVLPDKGVGVEKLLSSSQTIASMFNPSNEVYSNVVYKIPKFSFRSGMYLNSMLKALGIPSAFSDSADFSGINKDVKLSFVQQQTYISIDETGAEAAAYTIITAPGAGAPPKNTVTMTLNRPFIYGILSREGVPLFVGVCRNPA